MHSAVVRSSTSKMSRFVLLVALVIIPCVLAAGYSGGSSSSSTKGSSGSSIGSSSSFGSPSSSGGYGSSSGSFGFGSSSQMAKGYGSSSTSPGYGGNKFPALKSGRQGPSPVSSTSRYGGQSKQPTSSGGYGQSLSSNGGYGQKSSGSRSSGGYGSGGSYDMFGRNQATGQVIQAAVHTRHQIEFRDVPSSGDVTPTTIEVGANSIPLNILFRSASSNLNIQQAHDGAEGSVQETTSEDEPHRLIHSVTKPIIQEIHEVITPFRKITQEIQPVQEEILTLVARNNDKETNSYGEATSTPAYGTNAAQLKGY